MRTKERRQLSPRDEGGEGKEMERWFEQGIKRDWEEGTVMLVKQMYRDPSIGRRVSMFVCIICEMRYK